MLLFHSLDDFVVVDGRSWVLMPVKPVWVRTLALGRDQKLAWCVGARCGTSTLTAISWRHSTRLCMPLVNWALKRYCTAQDCFS